MTNPDPVDTLARTIWGEARGCGAVCRERPSPNIFVTPNGSSAKQKLNSFAFCS
jgi:hypothetical protein